MNEPGEGRSWLHSGWGALVFVVVCQLAGVLGALTTQTGNSSWYQSLALPEFQPPGWLFGPVWTLLYALMGVAAWRVWRKGGATPGVRPALLLFVVQLALNAAWSPVFFGAHSIKGGLVIIVLLWVVLSATLVAFFRVDRPAGWMLVPYLAWVTFATVLNATILALN